MEKTKNQNTNHNEMLKELAANLREAGEMPSRDLYDAFKEEITLEDYNQMVKTMKDAKEIGESPEGVLEWLGDGNLFDDDPRR